MKYIWKAFPLVLAYFGTLSADFCREIARDLKVILERTEGVNGLFESIEPMTD